VYTSIVHLIMHQTIGSGFVCNNSKKKKTKKLSLSISIISST